MYKRLVMNPSCLTKKELKSLTAEQKEQVSKLMTPFFAKTLDQINEESMNIVSENEAPAPLKKKKPVESIPSAEVEQDPIKILEACYKGKVPPSKKKLSRVYAGRTPEEVKELKKAERKIKQKRLFEKNGTEKAVQKIREKHARRNERKAARKAAAEAAAAAVEKSVIESEH